MAGRASQTDSASELDDFWTEMTAIEAGKGQETHSSDDELSRTPDEGEQESAWLTDAGYGHLVSKFEEGAELADDVVATETTSLSRAQAAAVKKRVDTLNATLRKRKRTRRTADVRDIFTSETDGNVASEPGSELRGQEMTGRAPSSTGGAGSIYCVSNRITVVLKDDAKPMSVFRKEAPPSYPAASSQDVAVTLPFNKPVSPRLRHKTANGKEDKDNEDGSSEVLSYSVSRDALGVTRADDLGDADLGRIRALTLIELTALFDIYNISYIRRKPKKRLKDHGVYGVPLQTLLDQNQRKHPHLRVPLVFKQMIDHLESHALGEEGLLRIPGSVSRIKTLRAQIEERGSAFSWAEVAPHDAASLMKQFLRELPVPLLTWQYLDAFAKVECVPDVNEKLQALILLVLLLPDVHRHTLQMLLRFLMRVVDQHASNRMTLSGVAMIMAPNLFMPPAAARGRGKDVVVGLAMGSVTVVRLLLQHQHLLCTVPSFMVSQIRHQYEAEQLNKKSKERRITKFLGRKDKSDPYKKPIILNEADYLEAVIRVQAPRLAKFNTAVQLDPDVTAGDIIGGFHSRVRAAAAATQQGNGRSASSACLLDAANSADRDYLYEIGGNIGERRLDHRTKMLMLYRVNPNAQWIIKASSADS